MFHSMIYRITCWTITGMVLLSILSAGIREDTLKAQALVTQGQYSKALPILEAARQIAQVHDREHYPSILNSLGCVYYELGRLRDARLAYEQALEALHRRGETATHQVALTLNNLGPVYIKLNLLHKAEQTLTQAAQLDAQSGDEIDQAEALLNLGSVYRAEHASTQAERMFRESLAIRERNLASGDRDIAFAANNLGVLLRDVGRWDEAEPQLLRALSIWQAALPPNHPLIAAALNNLGVLYTNLGRLDEAERDLSCAVVIASATLPPDHPNLAAYMRSYAFLLRKLNRKKEAVQYEKAARLAHDRFQRENALGFTVDAGQSLRED